MKYRKVISVFVGIATIIALVVLVKIASTDTTKVAENDLVDNFETSIEMEGGVIVPPQDVPLTPDTSGKIKTTSKTTTSTKKSTGKLKSASKKTKTTTKKSTKHSKKSSVKKEGTVVTETTTVTTTTTKYKKGSKKTTITKKVKKTVKTTTTPKAVTTADIQSAAKYADSRLLQRFTNEGYKFVVDTGLTDIGLFSSSNKQITLRYQSDIVYHELGHYLAFTTGKMDQTAEWIKIYKNEAKKFDGENKAYVISNNKEYFAECYRDYVIRKSTLKAKRPESYAYIEKVLAKL